MIISHAAYEQRCNSYRYLIGLEILLALFWPRKLNKVSVEMSPNPWQQICHECYVAASDSDKFCLRSNIFFARPYGAFVSSG